MSSLGLPQWGDRHDSESHRGLYRNQVELFCPICVCWPIRVYSYGTPILSHICMSYSQLASYTYFILHVIFLYMQVYSCCLSCFCLLHGIVNSAYLITITSIYTVLHGGSYRIRIWSSPIRVWDCPICVCMGLSNSPMYIRAWTVPYVHKMRCFALYPDALDNIYSYST